MDIIKIITPKNTEQVKPEIFIQNWRGKYRVINPMAWNGVIRWREQLKTIFNLKVIVTFAIIIFLVWSYQHDVKTYQEFFNNVTSNPYAYCQAIQEGKGWERPSGDVDISLDFEVSNEYTNSLSSDN